jgi:hypothetical protein
MEVVVLGTLLGTWASFGVSLLLGQVEPVSFVTSFLLAVFLFKFEKTRINLSMAIIVLFFALFLSKLFSQMLVVDQQGIWAGGSNVWGDWAVHIGYITNWLYGDNFPPENPFYAGIRLSYPFLFDFTSAILAKSGLPLNWSLQLPGIVFGLVLVILIIKLSEKLTGSQKAAVVAVLIFMFSGGLGWIYLIPGQKILAIPPQGVKELTHSFEGNIQWVNFIISEMVPQRGILFGLTAALTIFLLWLEKTPGKYFLAGIIAGLVPFFHAHTFLAVMFAAAIYFLIQPRRLWFYFFLPAVILGLPQFLYFMPQVTGYSSGFIRQQWGWAAHVQNDNWLWFWFKNIGLMAVLIPIFWIQSYFKNKKLFWLYLPFALIFAVCNIWIFQPWENDNSKLLRFWYLGSSILVAWGLTKLKYKLIAVLFLPVIIFSGSYDATSWLDFNKNKLQMWSREDIKLSEIIKNITPKNSVFLTNDNHNHWVVDLAGRKIVMGFRGWLWSWGINYSARESDVFKMFQGDSQTPYLLAKYGIDYVVIGAGEKSNFNAYEDYFVKHYPLFLDMNGQKIFAVGNGIIRPN